MVEIIGENYKDCPRSPSGRPIPETIRLEVTGYKHEPLWYHKRGLMQTGSGFGRKIVTEHMIEIEKRWYRIYHCYISNSGHSYIIKSGKRIVIDLEDVVC